MKTLLSLFDYSGTWSGPFARNGWDVIQWDIKLDDFMDINLIEDAEAALEMFEDVDGILAAAPCTDFASSGARWWKEKDADGRTAASIELVNQVERLVDLFRPTDPDYDGTFFWAVENPVGRIGKLTGLGPALTYFDPCEFAGWLDLSPADLAELVRIRAKDGKDVTAEEAQFILDCNAYEKYTGLWGEFNPQMRRKPIAPCKGNAHGSPHMRKGGKGAKTKEVRSTTPAGFAEAFYEANKSFYGQLQMSLFDYL